MKRPLTKRGIYIGTACKYVRLCIDIIAKFLPLRDIHTSCDYSSK